MNRLPILSIFLPLLLLAAIAFAENSTGFEDVGFIVTITANKDGTAHVEEQVYLLVSPAMTELYEPLKYSQNLTIDDWRATTGSPNLRYHVVGPQNTHVVPMPLQRFTFVNKSQAVVVVAYDTSRPIFRVYELGPRRTAYALMPDALSFENAAGGQVIPKGAVLVINVLPHSQANLSTTCTSPSPTFPVPPPPYESQLSSSRYYLWNASSGGIRFTTFEFTFETEQSLDEEVSGFFSGVQLQAKELVLSHYGLLAGVLVVVLFSLFFMLKRAKAI